MPDDNGDYTTEELCEMKRKHEEKLSLRDANRNTLVMRMLEGMDIPGGRSGNRAERRREKALAKRR